MKIVLKSFKRGKRKIFVNRESKKYDTIVQFMFIILVESTAEHGFTFN